LIGQLHTSPNSNQGDKVKEVEMDHVARMGAMKNAYKILVGKCARKRPLGRPRRRWEDIRTALRE
jgi:hypothetical protein